VEELLYETYGFPPLEEEVELFMEEFDLNDDGKVSWEEFKVSMERIKEKQDAKAEKAKEYSSF
jgi:Ca2+-binding EF-hand superfamily protein